MRQSAAGEQRQLLAAHETVHQVERRDARFDEVAGHRARHGVDRQAVDAQVLARRHRRAPVDHLADAVENAPENRRGDAERQRLAEETHDGAGEGESGGRFEDLDGQEFVVDRRHASEARAIRRRRGLRPHPAGRRRACAAGTGAALRAALRRLQPWDASLGSDLAVSAANSRSIAACSASKRASSVVRDVLAQPLQRPHACHLRDVGRRDACGDGLLRQIEESIEQAHHRGLPRGRAHAVILRERGLAQERVVDEPRAEQRELLAHRQARPCR